MQELLSFPLPCFIILFSSRGLFSLSVFFTCDAFSSTVVFCLEFTKYLIRIKGPLNLSQYVSSNGEHLRDSLRMSLKRK